MAEIASEFLPAGTFNVVTGDRDTGRRVVEHSSPAMVAITGSVRAGAEVALSAAPTIKRVHLELGGKAPVIVFDDADLEAAVEGIATAGYFNAGQDCTAATRVLAGPGIHGDFVEALADYARTQAVVGMPDNDDALLGPVNNATQLERVTGFIQRLPGHATVSAGGNRLTAMGEGYFLEPTVLSGLRQEDEAVQQEIFGPVITVQQFDDEAQALALGERRGLRPGLLGLDQGLRSRDADVRRAGLRVRLDQHPHPHRRRDAARGLQEVRLRQGPLDVRVRGLHADQARHGQHPELNPHDPTRAERKAPPMTPIPRRGRRPLSPAAAAVAQAAGGGLSRRALLGSGVAASAGLALTGCAPPEPPTGGPAALELPEDLSDSEKTIKWSNWTAYLDVNTKETKSPTLSAFMEQSGIEVSYFEDIDDNDSYYAKVAPQLRAGQSIDRDIFTLTDWMASRVIRDQLCQPVELIQMPNVVQNMLQPLKDASFDPGRNNSITWQSGFAGIGYNRDTVGRELKTLDDLWTDDLKGRIVVLSEFRDTAALVMQNQGVDIESDWGSAEFENAVAFIEQKIDEGYIRKVKGNSYMEDLTSGNAVAGITWSGDIFVLGYDTGDPSWTFTIPESGGTLWSDNLMVPITSTHRRNAQKLMDYYYDPAVAAELAAWVNYVCPVVGAQAEMEKIDPELAESPWIFPTTEFIAERNIQQFRVLSAEEDIEYADMWSTRVMGN